MVDLDKILRDQFEDFDITPQHLGQIIRDNNKTRKRTTKYVLYDEKSRRIWGFT